MINIALPKGRLGDKAYAIFESAGYQCPEIFEGGRRLVFENEQNGVRYFWVKPSDVAIYVERGAADIGVAGKDILLEYAPDVYELLDLGIGRCRMSVAAKNGRPNEVLFPSYLPLASSVGHWTTVVPAGIWLANGNWVPVIISKPLLPIVKSWS